jgi:hypothetical protein
VKNLQREGDAPHVRVPMTEGLIPPPRNLLGTSRHCHRRFGVANLHRDDEHAVRHAIDHTGVAIADVGKLSCGEVPTSRHGLHAG